MKRYLILSFILILLVVISSWNRVSLTRAGEPDLTGRLEKIDISNGKIISRDVYYCASSGGELRNNPSLCSELIIRLEPGTPLIVKDYDCYGWVSVILTDGSDGWIHSIFISKEPGENYIANMESRELGREMASRGSYVASGVVQTAYKYMGVPYVWGGSSPNGFDCSGFVQWVYARNGVNITRTADTQYNEGVSVRDLEPGDLVFFSTYAPGASHVGIYLGCTLFIHASSSGSVRINSLDEDFYKSVFIGGRRYFN